MRNSMAIYQIIKFKTVIKCSNLTSEYVTTRMKNRDLRKCLHTSVYNKVKT